jgi:plastocyanin
MDMGGEATPEPAETVAGASNEFEIAMVDDRFDPTSASIERGTTVAWVNKGRNWHSVASFDGSFESSKISPGEQFTHLFDQSGTFKYICKHHGMQGMIGVVVVTDPG